LLDNYNKTFKSVFKITNRGFVSGSDGPKSARTGTEGGCTCPASPGRDDNAIEIYARDPETGALTLQKDRTVRLNHPVCVQLF